MPGVVVVAVVTRAIRCKHTRGGVEQRVNNRMCPIKTNREKGLTGRRVCVCVSSSTSSSSSSSSSSSVPQVTEAMAMADAVTRGVKLAFGCAPEQLGQHQQLGEDQPSSAVCYVLGDGKV